ncbi:Uncharacterised protein [Bordetella pertussis]|nr:Uncharacterised protein [Bordetella pertussis]
MAGADLRNSRALICEPTISAAALAPNSRP